MKTCEDCSASFPCTNRTQAVRNRRCPDCVVLRLRAPRKKKPMSERLGMVEIVCAVCATAVWRPKAWVSRVSVPICSRRCNGKLRAVALVKHSHKGRTGWTAESLRTYTEKMTGENNPAWKGGVTLKRDKGNYIGPKYVRCPPEFLQMARKDGYVMEHRLVLAKAIGRCLTRTEAVHHTNHDSRDNRIENLMLFANNRDHKLYEHHGSPLPIWRP